MKTIYPKIDLFLLSEKARLIAEKTLEKAKNYNFRCLLLLDPFLSPINDEVIDFFSKVNRVIQIRIMHTSIFAQKRPLLIELNLQNEFDYQTLIYSINKAYQECDPQNLIYGGGRQHSAWLFTSVSIEKIADDFAKLALQHDSDGTYLLRFYDPAIFPQLLSILTSSQQQKLYGKIDCWSLLDGNGELVNYQNTQNKRVVLSGDLNLISTTKDRLFCVGINNQLLKKFRLENPKIKIDECNSLALVMPCLLRLLAKNMTDEVLLIEWAKLALKYHPDFDLAPSIIDAIKDFKTHYDFYRWIESIDTFDWQNIINNINVTVEE